MTVYFDKRRQRWTFDFEKSGARHSGYCLDALGAPVRSRSAAIQAEGVEKRRAEIDPKVARPGEMTLAIAAAALTPVWATQANWRERQRWLKEILAFFGAATAIAAIDQARVDDYVAHCRTVRIASWRGGPLRDPRDAHHAGFWKPTARVRAAATANLYLGTLRQIFARASAHRDPRTGRPAFEYLPEVPELARPKRKARPMPSAVAAEIMAIMPAHVIDAMVLTALFGFRRGEVFALLRNNIDWDGEGVRLYAEDVKDAEDTFLPASQFALGWLRCMDMDAELRGIPQLIAWKPERRAKASRNRAAIEPDWKPLAAPGNAWKRARAMMIEKFGRSWRWHDLRAAFITHVALGSGGVVAQALARHSDPKTTQGYIEVADEMRRLAAQRVSDQAMAFVDGKTPRHESQTAKVVKFG
jgi:integrase